MPLNRTQDTGKRFGWDTFTFRHAEIEVTFEIFKWAYVVISRMYCLSTSIGIPIAIIRSIIRNIKFGQ